MSASALVIELTYLAKIGGPLTKRISLAADGSLVSDGSTCTMVVGKAERAAYASMEEFAEEISCLRPHEAIALGSLRGDLPDEVKVVTKRKLEELNGTANNLIARTSDHILYRIGQPALALIDVDTKGMPDAVRDKIKALGGFWNALVSVLPELAHTARVVRSSTSTGISNGATGEKLPGSNGAHIFPLVRDGGDIERFLRALHDRCWLAGFGWYLVGASGSLLERSIVDRMVYAGERLVFEGAPVLDPPLIQDLESRKAVVYDGEDLDTLAACPPLRVVEKARLDDIHAKDAHRLAPDRAKARTKFVTEHADLIVKRIGCTVEAARRTVEKQCDGVLLSDVVLPFDDKDLEGCTVGDVLADPEKFVGATLADPLEGVGYGTNCAKVMRRPDGSVWINSFAHGRAVYDLQYDARDAQTKLRALAPADVPDGFVRLVLEASLNEAEVNALRNLAHDISGISKLALDATLKSARKAQAKRRAQAQRHQQAAQRLDPRPRIDVPLPDAPWLPQMQVVNDVLATAAGPEPPTRDSQCDASRLRARTIPLLHLLSINTDNSDDASESDSDQTKGDY
jgi:hypothetical protein